VYVLKCHCKANGGKHLSRLLPPNATIRHAMSWVGKGNARGPEPADLNPSVDQEKEQRGASETERTICSIQKVLYGIKKFSHADDGLWIRSDRSPLRAPLASWKTMIYTRNARVSVLSVVYCVLATLFSSVMIFLSRYPGICAGEDQIPREWTPCKLLQISGGMNIFFMSALTSHRHPQRTA